MKKLSLWPEFKAYWSFQMTSDVTCLEMYKNIKIMHCSVTWMNLIYMDFQTFLIATHILPNTHPALSCDQDLLSFSWVNRFPAGKVNWKVLYLVQYVSLILELLVLSNRTMSVASLACAITWLPWYTMHISWYNRGIPRMWTDFGKTLVYSLW